MLEANSFKALVVAIGGCSGGGKSSLARVLSEVLPNAIVLHLDKYYFDEDYPYHKKIDEYDGFIDWDCLESIDFDSFFKYFLSVLDKGKPDDTTNTGHHHLKVTPETFPPIEIDSDDGVSQETWLNSIKSQNPVQNKCLVIILEGLFILDYPSLKQYLDISYFITLPFEEALERRIKRQYIEPNDYFIKYAWPPYLKSLSNISSDVKLIDGSNSFRKNLCSILSDIISKLEL